MASSYGLPTRTIRLPSGGRLRPFHYYDLRPASDTMFAGAFARRDDRTNLLCSPKSLIRVGESLSQFEGRTCWYNGKGSLTLVNPGLDEAGWRRIDYFPDAAQQSQEAGRWAEVVQHRRLAIKLATSSSLQSFRVYHYDGLQDRFILWSGADQLFYVTATGDAIPLTYQMASVLNGRGTLVFNAMHNIIQRKSRGRTDENVYTFDWPTVALLRIWAVEHPANSRKSIPRVQAPAQRPLSVAQPRSVPLQTNIPKGAQVAFASKSSSTASASSQSVSCYTLKIDQIFWTDSKDMQYISEGQVLYIPWAYNGVQFEDSFALRSGAFYLIHSTGVCRTPLSYRDLPGIRAGQDKLLDPQAVVRCDEYNWIYQKDASKLAIPGRLVLAHQDAPFTVKFPQNLVRSLPPRSAYASASSLRQPSRSSIAEPAEPVPSRQRPSSTQNQTARPSQRPSSSRQPFWSQNQRFEDMRPRERQSGYTSGPMRTYTPPVSRTPRYKSWFSKTAISQKLARARDHWRARPRRR